MGGAQDRKNSIKGGKDAIDLLGLLFYSDLNNQKLRNIFSRYGFKEYLDFLISTVARFDRKDLAYLNLTEHEFSTLKKE